MKIGIVGVGKWGRTLATAFQAEGAQIVGYRRQSKAPAAGLGRRMRLDAMAIELDALIVAAPPATTLHAALYGSRVGIPVLATKPLMLEAPIPLSDTFYVDYWRLWNPAYLALKKAVLAAGIDKIEVKFYGNGPTRNFPGLTDYGPHGLVYLHDLVSKEDLKIITASIEKNEIGDRVSVTGHLGSSQFELQTGNGYESGRRTLDVFTKTGELHMLMETQESVTYANPQTSLSVPKIGCLSPMVRAFMSDAHEGVIDQKMMLLSVAVTTDLRKIQSFAASDLQPKSDHPQPMPTTPG